MLFFSLVYFFVIHDNFVNLQAEILNIKKWKNNEKGIFAERDVGGQYGYQCSNEDCAPDEEGTEVGVCHYCNGECGWTEGCEDVQRDEVHRDGG